jgi:hypothetical protein
MRRKKKRAWLILLILLAVGFIIFYKPAPKVKRQARPHVKAPSKRHRHAVKKKIPSKLPAAVPHKYPFRVSIVLDDMGQDVRLLDEIISLNMPVSVAVLHTRGTLRTYRGRRGGGA